MTRTQQLTTSKTSPNFPRPHQGSYIKKTNWQVNKLNADEVDDCPKFHHLDYPIHHEWDSFFISICVNPVHLWLKFLLNPVPRAVDSPSLIALPPPLFNLN
jgi:hypothetical protein